MSARWAWLAAFVLLGSLLPAAPRTAAAAAVTIPFQASVTAVADGFVTAGEYPATYADPLTGMSVGWAQDGTNLTVGLVSPGLGWTGIGFGPEGVLMDGSNILIGYVLGGTTVLEDAFGVGLMHYSDVSLGGRADILAYAGSESAGKTTIEFRIPMNSGDAYDIELRPGKTYSLLLAYQDTADDLLTLHTLASVTSLDVQRDPSRLPTRHAGLTIAGDGEPREGGDVTLVATLVGDDGRPMAAQVVEFWVNTSVGDGPLGSDETDANGTAGLNYTFLSPGPFRFLARFGGDADYLPVSANVTLSAAATPPRASQDAWGLGIRALVNVSLVGVVLVCLFSLDQVRRIRRLGRALRKSGGTASERGP